MANLNIDISTSINTNLVLVWTPLVDPNTGGNLVSIDNYYIEWDQGSSIWISLITTNLLTYTVSSLTPGTSYTFRI